MAISNNGGRAWTEQEEKYLLEKRQQKMPYKHIAAELSKTELACRLHYHQLSHGPVRGRRRAHSCSSTASSRKSQSKSQSRSRAAARSAMRARCSVETNETSASPQPDMGGDRTYAHHHQSRSLSPMALPLPDSSPASCSTNSSSPPCPPSSEVTAEMFKRYMTMPLFPSQVRLAKRPAPAPEVALTGVAPSIECPTGMTLSHHGYPIGEANVDYSGLAPPSAATMKPAHVDPSRLQSVYDTHRDVFWAAMAHATGSCGPQKVLNQRRVTSVWV